MDIYFILALVILVYKASFTKDISSGNYMDKTQTDSIKGFFIFIVFFCHFDGYSPFTVENAPMLFWLRTHIRQLLVTLFLFYSGYGIMESIHRKGSSYVNEFPRHRIFPVWFNYALAVLLYLLIAIISETKYAASTIFLSFLGWESIGNSNWYIFAIIFMYFATWISFLLFKKERLALLCNLFLAIFYFVLLVRFKGRNASWWYNTIICYPLGMYFSAYRIRMDAFIKKHPYAYYPIFLSMLSLFCFTFKISKTGGFYWNQIWYQIMCVFFCLTIVLLSMKVYFHNRILAYFGGSAMFSLYILQRLPMIYLQPLLQNYSIIYFGICVGLTCLLAHFFNAISTFLLSRFFK